MDIVNVIIWVILGVLGLILVGAVIFFIAMEKKYRNKAIIKDPNNRSSRVVFDRFKVYTDKDGISWFKLRKLKKVLIPPPPECIEGDNKGRMVCTWYRIDSENFIPGKDGYELIDEKKFIQSIKPFKTEQRAITIAQYKKSEREKKKSWSEMLTQAVPYIVIIMLVALMLIFVPDVVEQRAQVDSDADLRMIEMLDKLESVTRNLDNLVNDRGVLSDNALVEAPN